MLLYRLNILGLNIFGGVLLAATSVAHAQAPEPQSTANAVATPHGLAPAQITAIRAIGRNVLAAKKSAVEDPADAAQLAKLRGMVESLIATDLDSTSQTPITLQIQGGQTPGPSPARVAATALRETTRIDARALAGQMRQRGELIASRAQSGAASETNSAGLPIGGQRAQLFKSMAQKLETALAANTLDRVVQLHALRDQLQAGRGRLIDAPLEHGTPTLQAMPSTSDTRIRPVSAAEVKFRAEQATPGMPGAPIKIRTPGVQAK